MRIPPQINIITVVDVVGVLSSDTLNGNLVMTDNSRSPLTTGQGTNALRSGVTVTQVLNWHVWGVDVQTDILPSGLRWFQNGQLITSEAEEPCVGSKIYGAPSGPYWAAAIKFTASGLYQYQLELVINSRKKIWMDSFPSINVVGPDQNIPPLSHQ